LQEFDYFIAVSLIDLDQLTQQTYFSAFVDSTKFGTSFALKGLLLPKSIFIKFSAMENYDWSAIVYLITVSFLFVVIRPSPRTRDENSDLYHRLGNLRIFVDHAGLLRKESAPIADAHPSDSNTKTHISNR
jgi:hypothetical protein